MDKIKQWAREEFEKGFCRKVNGGGMAFLGSNYDDMTSFLDSILDKCEVPTKPKYNLGTVEIEEAPPLKPQQALMYHIEEIRGVMKGKGVDREISRFYVRMSELLGKDK